jgi:predicted ATPase
MGACARYASVVNHRSHTIVEAMRLRKVHLKNILSFGDAALSEIGDVNLLIGPNASGKTNFLDALSMLQAAPRALGDPIAKGGGIREWIWKGQTELFGVASIECSIEIEESNAPLQYLLSIQEANHTFAIHEERLVSLRKDRRSPTTPIFDREGGNIVFRGSLADHLLQNGNRIIKIAPSVSVLSAIRDPLERRELTAVGKGFDAIRIYRNFDTSGPNAGARHGVSTSYPPSEALSEDGHNLALILSRMRLNGSIKKVESYLAEFCGRLGEVHVDPTGGIARIHVRERGFKRPTPGVRLSDGTLKFLCLLVVLFNNEAEHSVVCIPTRYDSWRGRFTKRHTERN